MNIKEEENLDENMDEFLKSAGGSGAVKRPHIYANMLSPDHHVMLKDFYELNSVPSRADYIFISEILNINEVVVRQWYHNQRARDKRNGNQVQHSSINAEEAYFIINSFQKREAKSNGSCSCNCEKTTPSGNPLSKRLKMALMRRSKAVEEGSPPPPPPAPPAAPGPRSALDQALNTLVGKTAPQVAPVPAPTPPPPPVKAEKRSCATQTYLTSSSENTSSQTELHAFYIHTSREAERPKPEQAPAPPPPPAPAPPPLSKKVPEREKSKLELALSRLYRR